MEKKALAGSFCCYFDNRKYFKNKNNEAKNLNSHVDITCAKIHAAEDSLFSKKKLSTEWTMLVVKS